MEIINKNTTLPRKSNLAFPYTLAFNRLALQLKAGGCLTLSGCGRKNMNQCLNEEIIFIISANLVQKF